MILHRRQVLAGLAGAALLPAPLALAKTLDLAGIARVNHRSFGSAFDREIFEDVAYAALIASQCWIGSIENSLKFDWLRPHGPEAEWDAADRLVAFAHEHRLFTRGTALIWNDWPPDWLKSLSSDECAAMMDRHIEETINRYGDLVDSWDVVNEPFFPPHGADGGYRTGPWFAAMGPDYITRAYKRAAAANPRTQLVLNEAFCEQFDELGNSIRPLLLNEVRRIQDAGVKLHAVGFEAHLKPHLPSDDAAFAAYLEEIAALGVDIMITELDVDDSHMPDDVAVRDDMVAARVRSFLNAVLQVKSVNGVICWHLSDKYSWYQGDWYADMVAEAGGDRARPVRSHLFDKDLKPKPAAFAVADALSAPR